MINYLPIDLNNVLSGGAYDGGSHYFVYFLLFVIVAVIIYKFWGHYNSLVSRVDDLHRQPMPQEQRPIAINVTRDTVPPPPPTQADLIRRFDYRTIYDPLTAPRTRSDYDLPWVPYPTRGFAGNFHKKGLLIDKRARDNDRYKILLLMGRNTYPGSRDFEYYATENASNGGIKFDLGTKRELYDGNHLQIGGLDKHYTVVMDQTLGYSYDPYV